MTWGHFEVIKEKYMSDESIRLCVEKMDGPCKLNGLKAKPPSRTEREKRTSEIRVSKRNLRPVFDFYTKKLLEIMNFFCFPNRWFYLTSYRI